MEKNENEQIKIGLGTFTIIVIALVILVVTVCGTLYLSHIANVNTGNNKTKNNRQNTTSTGIVGTKNTLNNNLTNETVIDVKNTYALACKSVITGSRYDLENSLIAIDKNTGAETKIMKFGSGAYDYADGKLYFYENTANSYHRFYETDLDQKGLEPKEIYSFEYKFGSTDNLEYYNNKLYYTFNDELLSLNLVDNQITHIANVKNCIFDIDKSTGVIYYVNDEENLIAMNLETREENVIDNNSGIIEISNNRVLYVKMDKKSEQESETWYWTYNIDTKEKHKLVECWGGEIGKTEITRYGNSGYMYLNGEGQLAILEDNENIQNLTDEGNFSSLAVLPNNNILLERNETEEDQDNHKTYIYNIDNKTLVSTTNNYRYSYVKYIK